MFTHYPVCDWWSLPLPPPASDCCSLDRRGGEKVPTGCHTVTDSQHGSQSLHFCSTIASHILAVDRRMCGGPLLRRLKDSAAISRHSQTIRSILWCQLPHAFPRPTASVGCLTELISIRNDCPPHLAILIYSLLLRRTFHRPRYLRRTVLNYPR